MVITYEKFEFKASSIASEAIYFRSSKLPTRHNHSHSQLPMNDTTTTATATTATIVLADSSDPKRRSLELIEEKNPPPSLDDSR
ncbi:hypothetical protein glysoja_035346 [Glycine soja]|uniref:Uncharacterized protein n=1 Tax=Glycine soja TaxID=3848 RepID=A0A0B2PXW3_GLYSO|nr:hypothetical protein glysoja_035346 [Glycine soja]